MKIISGLQTGVDQAALRAACDLGIATGGWAPKDFWTLDGTCADLAQMYGLSECQEEGYRPRTFLNVKSADATIRIAQKFTSPGERCTYNAIRAFNKPYLDIEWRPMVESLDEPGICVEEGFGFRVRGGSDGSASLSEFLSKLAPDATVNFAGNSETTAPGIGDAVYDLLVLELLPFVTYAIQS